MEATVSTNAAIWQASLEKIAERVADPQVYDTFFGSSKITGVEGKHIYVAVNSPVAAQVLSKNYARMVNEVLSEVTQTDFEVEFVYDSNPEGKKESSKEHPVFFPNSAPDPNFTFDNFVEGESNRSAYQAALMAANAPADIYNPLFIYGGSGLGKTHLLHAIGNAYKAKHPGKEVLYVTADGFFDGYVRFLKYIKDVKDEKRGNELRDYFRDRVDMLLVDDVQFLRGREQTEETFFHVFEVLVAAKRQIVLTSDTHPSKLEGFPARLKTRFGQGLTLSVTPPDQETAEKILWTKISAYGFKKGDIDEEIVTFFAKRFSNNVRDLEGRLTQLFFYMSLHPGEKIGLDEAKKAVQGEIEAKEEKERLSEEKIVNAVADYYYLAPSQILGKNRTGQISLARHVAMYLIRDVLDLPFARIGAYFGKDHSTVISGVSNVEKSLKTNPEMKKAVTALKAKLKS